MLYIWCHVLWEFKNECRIGWALACSIKLKFLESIKKQNFIRKVINEVQNSLSPIVTERNRNDSRHASTSGYLSRRPRCTFFTRGHRVQITWQCAIRCALWGHCWEKSDDICHSYEAIQILPFQKHHPHPVQIDSWLAMTARVMYKATHELFLRAFSFI